MSNAIHEYPLAFNAATLGKHDRVYLAGRFDRKDELRGYAEQLIALDYHVTSRWLFGAHECDGACTPETLERFALEDLTDIANSDLLLAFTELPGSGYQSGGRHVELGYALGFGLDVAIVGPRENVFHHIARYYSAGRSCKVRQFDTFADLLARRAAVRELAIASGDWPEDQP